MSLNHKIIIRGKLNICMQEQGYIWKLFISECGAMGRDGWGGPDMTDCAVCGAGHCCHGDSVTHSSLIWILELCCGA